MTQEEYREMERLKEEIRSLRVDNGVWSAQVVGFKDESDMRGRQIKMLGEEADLLIEKMHEMEAEHYRLREELRKEHETSLALALKALMVSAVSAHLVEAVEAAKRYREIVGIGRKPEDGAMRAIEEFDEAYLLYREATK